MYVNLYSELKTEVQWMDSYYVMKGSLSVSSRITVSKNVFGFAVHLLFIWLFLRVSL